MGIYINRTTIHLNGDMSTSINRFDKETGVRKILKFLVFKTSSPLPMSNYFCWLVHYENNFSGGVSPKALLTAGGTGSSGEGFERPHI